MTWAHRRRHGSAAVQVITAILLTLFICVTPLGAPHTQAAPAADSEAKVMTESISPRALNPGQDLTLTVRVAAPKDSSLIEAEVRVLLQRQKISTRSGLQNWMNRTIEDDAGAAILTVTVPAIGAGESATVPIVIPATNLGLSTASAQAGPRALGVELRTNNSRIALERSFLPWNMSSIANSPQLSLAVLTPLIAPQADPLTGLATASSLGPLTANLAQGKGPLRDIVDQLSGPFFSWAIDPALLAAADTGGTTTQEWLTRFLEQAQGKSIIELPYSDPDLAAVAHANRQELAVTAMAMRDSVENHLNNINVATGVALPVGGATDQLTANLAARIGATSLVVSSELLAPQQELTYTPTGRVQLQTSTNELNVALSDATLDSIFSSMRNDNASASTQWLLAETAVIALERPNDARSILTSIPRDWNPGSAAFGMLSDAFDSSSWLSPTSVSQLLETPAPDIARIALIDKQINGSEATPKQLSTAIDSRDSLKIFGQIVADPQSVIGPLSNGWITLASTAWRQDLTGRDTAIAAQVEATRALIDSIYIVIGSSITVVSDSSNIPVTVHNDLAQEVRVSVKMWSWPSLMVSEGSAVEVIPANSERTVQVPIEVIASGEVTMTTVLATEDGTRFSEEQKVQARMHVNWETIGTLVIGGGLLTLVLVGLYRVIRRGRRRDGTTRTND